MIEIFSEDIHNATNISAKHYCPANVNISTVWLDSGISLCFYYTFFPAILLAIVLVDVVCRVCSSAVCGSRPRDPGYLSRLRSSRAPQHPFLYRLQLFLTVISLLLVVAKVIILIEMAGYHPMYVVFDAITESTAYIFSVILIFHDVKRRRNSYRKPRHSCLLHLFWALAVVLEICPLISWLSPHWWWPLSSDNDVTFFGLWLAKLVVLFVLFVVSLKGPGFAWRPRDEDDTEEASQSLLEVGRPETGSTWANFSRKIGILFPYLWPQGKPRLQLYMFLCYVVLAAGRVVNVFIPIFYKKIVDQLSIGPDNNYPTLIPFAVIIYYVLFRLLQGSGSAGLLNSARALLFIKVQQNTSRSISVRLFSHLHALSLRWHLGRKTGEVIRVMDRGTTSINSVLQYLTFNIIPTIADIIIAVVYFMVAFNIYFGLIVLTVMVIYLVATITITEWRTKFRRAMNEKDNATKSKAIDSLLNFETVKYYGAEDYEVDIYNKQILNYQECEWKSQYSLVILNTTQSIIVNIGLLGGALLCAHYVVDRTMSSGDYVLFSTYIIQLYVPLNFFGTIYQVLQNAFIDMENMFSLLKETQEVTDIPDAPELLISQGEIRFNDVCFNYRPDKSILRGINFVVPAGRSVAVVGPSGSGKSTIIRLIFRFFDVNSGSITIDGQDISRVRQTSLRQSIGVVPQDTVLFNNDIRANIRYGKVTSSEEEVVEAAKAADIHSRIEGFPDGYETAVGERGLKLSGGEKQRVAIARTLLKAPQIVLLDEATSALDTKTERNIQASLNRICADRTSLIVAHRLSTIQSADQILVLQDGEITERGCHAELLRADGVYADMWRQQQSDVGGEGALLDESSGSDKLIR